MGALELGRERLHLDLTHEWVGVAVPARMRVSTPGRAAVALAQDGPAVFAAFEVPVVPTATVDREVGLETLDGGASWILLPVAAGATVPGFGGFRYQADLVEALYTPANRDSRAVPPLVEGFDPSSGTWRPTAVGCPSSGPWVTLGPLSASSCAGGVHDQQEMLRSRDGAASWREPL